MFEEREDAQEVSALIGNWAGSTSRNEVVSILRLVEKYVKGGDQFSTEFSTKLTAPHAKNPSNGGENTNRRAMFDGVTIVLFARVIKPGFHPAAVESDVGYRSDCWTLWLHAGGCIVFRSLQRRQNDC